MCDFVAAFPPCAVSASLMRHRGPCGEGMIMTPAVSMAHVRLAILDLSMGGLQPLVSNDFAR